MPLLAVVYRASRGTPRGRHNDFAARDRQRPLVGRLRRRRGKAAARRTRKPSTSAATGAACPGSPPSPARRASRSVRSRPRSVACLRGGCTSCGCRSQVTCEVTASLSGSGSIRSPDSRGLERRFARVRRVCTGVCITRVCAGSAGHARTRARGCEIPANRQAQTPHGSRGLRCFQQVRSLEAHTGFELATLALIAGRLHPSAASPGRS